MIVGFRNQFVEKQYTFSESEVDDLVQRAFAQGYQSRDDEERDERRARREARRGYKLQDSHRGLGRSLILGGLPGSMGAYMTKDDVDNDYREGLSEEEIVSRASRKGGINGAAIGGTLGAIGGAGSAYLLSKGMKEAYKIDPVLAPEYFSKAKPGRAALVGGLGLGTAMAIKSGLGGYLGAKKNARERLELPRVEVRNR